MCIVSKNQIFSLLACCLLLLLLLLLILILKTNKVEIMYHVFFRGIYRQHLKDRIWIGSFSSCFLLLLCCCSSTLLILIYLRSLTFMCEFISYLKWCKNSFVRTFILFCSCQFLLCCCGFCGQYSSASRQSCHTHFSLFLLINFKMWNFSNWIFFVVPSIPYLLPFDNSLCISRFWYCSKFQKIIKKSTTIDCGAKLYIF